jgi:hypothetical protein
MIFLRAVRQLLDPVDQTAPRKAFFVEYGTEAGDVVRGNVICTSSNFNNDTFNFRFVESGEIRTAHAKLLLSVNHNEVML